MSDMSITVEPPVKKSHGNPGTKRQKPWAVIVHNDEDHSFPYVITLFQKVFNYETEKCLKLTAEIHNKGKAVVWSGAREVAELKQEQIKSGGKDLYGEKPVEYPLGCTIEEMP